ncbi:MAG: hypothetical protein HRU18_01595 [Pseudoalteromonas sp.]|uniref:hypothetical protein n=1 Tax=Pseudoalteromonas sp. TaxID=53249 RepID=UPI001D52D40C|nr:hypothetical protein [Pseudoalteromonas sp.]NRA76875.1 hypothetical protein [Pseudoalteromonas sp.]
MVYSQNVKGISEDQANELYKFMISGGGIQVEGQMQNQLSIGGANGFTDVSAVLSELSDMASGISSKLGSAIGAVKAVKQGMDAVNQASSRSKVTDFESRLIWENSEKPQFAIEYTFYNQSQQQAESTKGALSMAIALQKAVLPSKGTPAKGRPGVFFKSPLGYKPKTGNSKVAEGTLTLSIGQWFRASDLVVRSTNFTPSIQVLGNGHPVLVKGSIVLEPTELITYETFLGYFRNVSVNQSSGGSLNEILGGLF